MKKLACLILLLWSSAALADFGATARTEAEACTRAKALAAHAGYASGACDCDPIGAMHSCRVASGGAQKSETSASFTYGGRTVSCVDAVKYRDTQLNAGMGATLETFDAAREQRLRDALAKFDADLAGLMKDMDGANRLVRRKLIVIAAGLAIGHAAEWVALSGLKAGASAIEKAGMEILAARGTEWVSVFMNYKYVSQEIDVITVAAMPATVLLALSPAAPLAWVWSVGTTAIDMADAFAERELVRGEINVTSAVIRKRAHDLLAKLQMPKIATLNAMKNEIDSQCNGRT